MSIRLACQADLPQILAIYGPYVETTAYSFEYTVPTLEAFTQRFLKITEQFAWLVWEEAGEILGFAYGSAPFERAAYRWSGEVSIYLRPDAQHRGIGRQLYKALEWIMEKQGYRLVYAIITAANEGSLAFHKAMGYQFTARFPGCGFKFGSWQDVIWMEKQLRFDENPMNFPIPAHAIVKSDRNLANILDKMSLS